MREARAVRRHVDQRDLATAAQVAEQDVDLPSQLVLQHPLVRRHEHAPARHQLVRLDRVADLHACAALRVTTCACVQNVRAHAMRRLTVQLAVLPLAGRLGPERGGVHAGAVLERLEALPQAVYRQRDGVQAGHRDVAVRKIGGEALPHVVFRPGGDVHQHVAFRLERRILLLVAVVHDGDDIGHSCVRLRQSREGCSMCLYTRRQAASAYSPGSERRSNEFFVTKM